MFNSIFLIYLFFEKKIINLINYLFILLFLNLIIGLWSCAIYDHLTPYGRFNKVIIIELNLFILKCTLFIINILYILISNIININDAEYTEELIATPILN